MQTDHAPIIAYGLENKDIRIVCRSLKQISRVRVEEIESIKMYVPVILGLLDSPNSDVRSCCCWTLGQIGFKKPDWGKYAMPTLAKLTVDSEANVREKAIWAMGRIGRAKPESVKE